MIKLFELSNPRSCMNRARDEEMTFVLLARDEAAPKTVRDWVQRRIKMGKNKPDDPQILEAIQCAVTMEEQRKALISLEPK